MNVLKGLVLGLLSLLLFLSLSIFGIAFTLNSTLLNPDFVASEVDKIEVSSLIRELTEEPIAEQLPQDMQFLKEAIYGAIYDQEPWLKERVNAAVYSGYDFLLGESDRLSLTVSLKPLKESLRDSLWQSLNQNLPPELSILPEDQLEQYFNQYYDEFTGQIPSELAVDESAIPPEAMEQIILAREYIEYFMTGYYALIGFMVLLVIGIILIYRNVKDTTRSLGIDFLVYGVLEFAGVYIVRHYAPIGPLLHNIPDIPPSLQTRLVGLSSDLLAPLQMFSLGILIIGAALLVVSFVYKRKAPEDEITEPDIGTETE